MSLNIDITETRQEVAPGGTAYVIETYLLSDRQSAQQAMTHLSVTGWRILASHLYDNGDTMCLTVVWEWCGPKGGRHFQKPNPQYRW